MEHNHSLNRTRKARTASGGLYALLILSIVFFVTAAVAYQRMVVTNAPIDMQAVENQDLNNERAGKMKVLDELSNVSAGEPVLNREERVQILGGIPPSADERTSEEKAQALKSLSQ